MADVYKAKPTLDKVAKDVREGGEGADDAALELARRAPCRDFPEFVRRFMPASDPDVTVFDRLRDAYARMEWERDMTSKATVPEKEKAA
jgi:hypothetical protein